MSTADTQSTMCIVSIWLVFDRSREESAVHNNEVCTVRGQASACLGSPHYCSNLLLKVLRWLLDSLAVCIRTIDSCCRAAGVERFDCDVAGTQVKSPAVLLGFRPMQTRAVMQRPLGHYSALVALRRYSLNKPRSADSQSAQFAGRDPTIAITSTNTAPLHPQTYAIAENCCSRHHASTAATK